MKIAIKILAVLILAALVWWGLQALTRPGSTGENEADDNKMVGMVYQTMPDSFVLGLNVKTMAEAREAEHKTIRFDQNTKFEIIALEKSEDPVILTGNISYLMPGVEAEVVLSEESEDLASTVSILQRLEPVVAPD